MPSTSRTVTNSRLVDGAKLDNITVTQPVDLDTIESGLSAVEAGLASHVSNTSNPHSTTKTQVGLGNVDNVQQMPLSYLDTDGTLSANSDTKVASQKATKTYVDTQIAGIPGTPDATSTVKGKLKLTGDLGGTADSPTVPGLAGKQATLVSGTNIKTINSISLLGSGDIAIAGTGTVTSVSSVNSDISVANGTTTPSLTLNSGTGANQIVKLDGSAKLPAVDGSQLTNLPAPTNGVTQSSNSGSSGRMKVSAGADKTIQDYATAGIVKSDANGVVSAAVANTDYAPVDSPIFTTRITTPEIKASNSGGVDVHNNAGTQVAIFGAGGSNGTSLVGTTNIGSASADYHQIVGGTGTITDTATGSSTDISINFVPKGSGKVKINGTNIPIVSGTDYAPATSGTAILKGNNSGGFANAVAGAGGDYTNPSHDHLSGNGNPLTEGALSLSDVTTNNATSTRHGFLPKLSNSATEFLNGQGNYVTPSGTTNSYLTQFFSTATSVVVTHNFGTTPTITVWEFISGSTYNVIQPLNIQETSVNSFTVTFSSSKTGKIVASVGSPQPASFITVSSNYSILTTDQTVNVSSGNITLTLPTAVGATGRQYWIKNSGNGTVTLATTSSQTIDGYASGTITMTYLDSFFLQSDGANWILLNF